MRAVIRTAAAALLAAAMGSCSMFDYSGTVVHKFALVYGVTRYTMAKAPGLAPNLQFPHSDASAMASLLFADGYNVQTRWVDDSGVVWINNGSLSKGLIGAPATNSLDGSVNTGAPGAGEGFAPSKANILADVMSLTGAVGPNDLLVIYFSGHGTQDTSMSPSREYFDPYGAVMQYTGDNRYYDFSLPSVRDDELAAAFAAISTPRKVLILDTCNSGGFIGNQLEADWTSQSAAGSLAVVGPGTLAQAISNYASMQNSPTGLSPYGAQVLAAAGRDESSYEAGPPISHGIMTYYLLQGLQGAADLNHDGHITVLEAFAYAKAGVDQNWNPSPPTSGSPFEPHISGGPVDFVLF